jgi:hypothetical protein
VAGDAEQPRAERPARAALRLRRAANHKPRYANGRVHRVMRSATVAGYPERCGLHTTPPTGVAAADKAIGEHTSPSLGLISFANLRPVGIFGWVPVRVPLSAVVESSGSVNLV